MQAFFQSVAEACACKGFRALAKEIPFGNFLYEVAVDAWKRLKEKKKEREAREEVAKMARAAAEEVKRAAQEAARLVCPKDPAKAIELELYLSQIPATVRQTLRRPEDPTGTTLPAGFTLAGPEQLLALLPNRVSEFRPGSPLPGRDGWHLAELLGIGGFGEVWRAKHPMFASLDRAVKFCTGLTDRERTLLHEGEVIDRVMRAGIVPNVVQLIDAHLTGPTPWLMYELVPGGDLVSLVDSWRSLPAAERRGRARTAWFQIVAAVAHFHKLGVVHRDLKPANVLTNGDTLKVTDFGIGGIAAKRELEAGAHAHTSTAGRLASLARGAFTPVYASPQQKKGALPDPRDDVYALGVIGYQMLVGDVTAERPAGKGWRRELESQGVRGAVLDVLESCWDDDPSERPKDAGGLLEQMNRSSEPTAAANPIPTPTPASPVPNRSNRPIELRCPSCEKRFRARGESAGKQVKCPYCQAPVQVPLESEPPTRAEASPQPAPRPTPPQPAPRPIPPLHAPILVPRRRRSISLEWVPAALGAVLLLVLVSALLYGFWWAIIRDPVYRALEPLQGGYTRKVGNENIDHIELDVSTSTIGVDYYFSDTTGRGKRIRNVLYAKKIEGDVLYCNGTNWSGTVSYLVRIRRSGTSLIIESVQPGPDLGKQTSKGKDEGLFKPNLLVGTYQPGGEWHDLLRSKETK